MRPFVLLPAAPWRICRAACRASLLSATVLGVALGLAALADRRPAVGGAGTQLAAARTSASALQARIDAAPPGGTVTVEGVEQGPIVLRRSVRLAGTPGAVIDGGGRGTIVRVEASDVILSRLTLRGSGADLNDEDAGIYVGAPGVVLEDLTMEDVLFGVNLKRADGAILRRVRLTGKDLPLSRRGDAVRLWYSHRVTMTDLRIRRLRDVLVWFSRSSTLHALDVTGSRYGVHLMYADDVRLLGGTFRDNAVGAYIMYSTGVRVAGNRFIRHRGTTGVGLAFKEADDVVVGANLFAGNHVGLYLDGTPRVEDGRSEITGNVVAGNETGIVLLGSATRNLIAGNRFDGNGRQVRVEGGSAAGNNWQRAGRGNYWSDYAALDADGNGVGDVPYRAREWFEGLEDRLPAAALFWGSVAVEAVDFAARLLPIFPPRVLAEDRAPLMTVPVPPDHQGGASSTLFGAVSLLLATAGLLSLWGVRGGVTRRKARPA